VSTTNPVWTPLRRSDPDPLEPVLHIRPSSGRATFPFRELWEYRELFYFLIWRDLKVRYRQTYLGAAWAVLQPLLAMVIFSLFFGRLAKIPSDGIPYPIFSYVALLPWMFVANGVSSAANSLVNSSNLVTKVYFPRLVIPMSSVIAGLVDFGIAFFMLFVMMFYYHIVPTARGLGAPACLLLAIILSLGLGFWFAALNVKYRDIRHIVPFFTQLWLFATPIVYPSSLLHEPWRTVFGLNPMTSVVEGFRWCLLGTGSLSLAMLAISIAVAVALLVSGALYFRRAEKTFADVI